MNIKGKTQKGITLVALIITIVILIILAVVSIGTISKEEIFQQAEEATNRYNQSIPKEQNTLAGYVEKLNKYFPIPESGGGNGNVDPIQVSEGDTVKYDSNNDGTKEDWIVLTAEPGLVEIVSAQPMGSLTLGDDDAFVNVTTDFDGDGTIGDNGDKCIASYNNAITTINNYCKSLVTATDNEGVRSVGGTNNDYTPFHSTNYDNWGKKIKVDVASTDEHYKTDYEKMGKLGIAKANERYWIASRIKREVSNYVYFNMRYVYTSGSLEYNLIWYLGTSGNVLDHGNNIPRCAVRPVVINPSGFVSKTE